MSDPVLDAHLEALKVLFNRSGRNPSYMSSNTFAKAASPGGNYIKPSSLGGPTVNMPYPSKAAYPPSQPAKPRVLYISEKRRWVRESTIRVDENQTITSRWTGCCVCKAISSADLGWWEPFYSVRIELLGVQKEPTLSSQYYKYFPYNPYNSKNYITYNDKYKWPQFDFGVCSKPCLSMFYLSMMDAPLEGK